MKIFVDTANLDEIRELATWGIVDGVTTNPTLVAKSGRPFEEIIDEIFEIVDGPISLEVVSEKADDMVKEAKNLVSKIDQKFQKNIAIKIPMKKHCNKNSNDSRRFESCKIINKGKN